jgi:FtsP/CotA-like multicopper oxidase with cupredoxin domain
MSATIPQTHWHPAVLAILLAALLLAASAVRADVEGEEGTTFELTASAGYVSTPDGASVYSWGFGLGGRMQLPGPTLIVNVGDDVTVTLTNALPPAAGAVSIVFQGQDVTATGGAPGLITREAPPGGTVTYTFEATRPGTYLYSSGTRPDLQVEMGLAGALIVRPTGSHSECAYANDQTCFDRENLYVLGEIDLDIHRAVELQVNAGGPIEVATSPYDPEYWLINGRCAPDTMAASGTTTLAHQPYNALTEMYPGERLLLRIVGAGRQMHPFHTHGNHVRVVGQDGRLIANDGGQLMGPLVFTVTSMPGATTDGIFTWTGQGLNWDIYGTPHVVGPDTCSDGDEDGFDDSTHEWCADHGKPIPVELPALQQLTFGGFWSGSPFLGVLGSLPPGEGGLNPDAGYTYMWHSHSEREIVNNDIFPGGMMTMLVIKARP